MKIITEPELQDVFNGISPSRTFNNPMEEEEEKKTLPRASFHFSGHLLCRQIASANSFSTPGKEMSVELLPEKRRERGREGRKAPPLCIWPDKMRCNHLHPDNYNPILLFILL